MTGNSKFNEIVKYIAATTVFSVLLFFYSDYAAHKNRFDPENLSAANNTVFYTEVSADQNSVPVPETSAYACALIDANSGSLIFSKEADTRLPMASTTKIMTAIIAIENSDLEKQVEVTAESAGIEGSSIYLAQGEILTMRELLYGLMLESGNDAATAIAISISGSTDKFTELMNLKAAELGLVNTHFDNPHGLSSDTHYTTAAELAKITAYALKNDIFRQIVATDKYVIAERDNCRARYFSNHNKLLRRLDICDGVKTGYTLSSGRCLVTSASTDSGRFIAVTLNDRNDWKDHEAMLNFAVDNFESIKIAEKGELKYSVPSSGFLSQNFIVSNDDDIYITVPKNSCDMISISVQINKYYDIEGQKAGSVIINTGDKTVEYTLTVKKVTDKKIF